MNTQKPVFSFNAEELIRLSSDLIFPTIKPHTHAMPKADNSFPDAALSCKVERGSFVLELTAVCDMVTKTESGYCADYVSSPENPLHRLNALVCAAILCRSRKLDSVTVREASFKNKLWSFKSEGFSASALSEALERRIDILCKLIEKTKLKSKAPVFPHPSLREGQRELMDACYDTIKSKKKLFVCAPTGMGKTLSFLYPALKAVERSRAKRVIFVTPKGSTQAQVQKSAESLCKGVVSMILPSRQSLCYRSAQRCECCSSGKLSAALEMLFDNSRITPSHILSAARAFSVCPTALARTASRLCDLIICDYNFLFDPKAKLDYFCDKQSILLIDEAHNLPDRVSACLSSSISPEDISKLKELFPPTSLSAPLTDELSRRFEVQARALENGKESISSQSADKEAELCNKIFAAFYTLDLLSHPQKAELLYRFKHFYKTNNTFSQGYVKVITPDGGIRLCLADPSEHIRSCCSQFGSAVFFSATLIPEEYFTLALGADPCDGFIHGTSPFDPDSLGLFAFPLNTSLSCRGQSMIALCKVIKASTSHRGRYIAFFPSFEYLYSAKTAISSFLKNLKVITQEQNMSPQSRAQFFTELSQGDTNRSVLALCVLGGLFSEGIELPDASLDGVIVVGSGMIPPSPEREAVCFYYNENDFDGRSFAYTLPGFNKVLQAIGRVIRKESDRGIAVLCDRHFADGSFDTLFPEHLPELQVCATPNELLARIRKFHTPI
ncbi:MAG: ATP-dependent DNA helicase [Ruminococcaceae bacterium]|nr:ATP-dependent DNA helicase [Oscillospiraceae bacterium]